MLLLSAERYKSGLSQSQPAFPAPHILTSEKHFVRKQKTDQKTGPVARLHVSIRLIVGHTSQVEGIFFPRTPIWKCCCHCIWGDPCCQSKHLSNFWRVTPLLGELQQHIYIYSQRWVAVHWSQCTHITLLDSSWTIENKLIQQNQK